MQPHKTYFNWSSGKDAAFALHKLLQNPDFQVDYLLTSINATYQRVSMHGLRRELLEQQLEATGIPFGFMELSEQATHEEYEQVLLRTVGKLKEEAYTYAGFGDIFLEDLRKYREQQLSTHQIKTVFPLWKRDTKKLAHEFLAAGFKTIVVCVDAQLLDESFVGRELDQSFLNDLPEGIDPCGENGEFHTFCYQAPFFKSAIPFSIGEKIYREYTHNGKQHGFWFCDLVPQ